MEHLYLEYYTNNTEDSKKLELFFIYQQVIKDDFKKLLLLVSDYEDSEEKESLLFNLNHVIKNITRNRFKEDPEMELNIRIVDNYLIFSYYMLDDEGITLNETPSIVIVSRDMKNIYFIDEVCSVFLEEEENDAYNRGYDEITYFKLENGTIKKSNCSLEDYTVDLFSKCFGYPDLMIKIIEEESKKYIKR